MKHYLVTGASRGIGREIVAHLAREQHTVFATARSEKPLAALQSEAPELIKAIPCDLLSPEISTLLKAHIAELDGLVFNAGSLINKPFSELSDADWMAMFQVNILGAVRVIRDLLPIMNPNSHIVLISSMGGFQGSSKFPGLSAYSASKGALSILAECLATELQSQQIAVNALCLGAVQTEMLAEAFPGFQAPVSAEQMGGFIADFLCSAHRFMNGKILPVSLADPG